MAGVTNLGISAAFYARDACVHKITSALDMYVVDMLREHYSANGIPPRGSVRWREAEQIMIAAYIDFHTYHEISSDYKERWKRACLD
jgi:hypothetical protein